MSREATVVHWFRKGLRLHDNPALCEAISQATKLKYGFRPIFILDTEIVKWMKIGNNRWRFLKQSLENLDSNLKEINSKLYIIRGDPINTLPHLFKKWNVKVITFEFDTEPYAKQRDTEIESIANKAGVEVIQRISHTIYDVRTVVRKCNGTAPLTYQKFLSVVETLPLPGVVEKPGSLPEYCLSPQDELEVENPLCYGPLSYEELNVSETDLFPCLYPGGETEALKRLDRFLAKKQWICKFEKPNTSPNSLDPSTTVLSPYLKFGCLSSRLFHQKIKSTIRGTNHTTPPISLIGQIMWREFFYAAGFSVPNFDKMEGNPICRQVPWNQDEEKLQAWKHGMTGYPFIDAIMRQLKEEGWIHHLARHAVACFLTRGDLWISWESGKDVFEEYLLDADWSLNAGNWLWLSASAFFHQYFRVYSPTAFGKKTDKVGTYIKKYVPELKDFPPEYIYEPWVAPVSFQNSVKCVIGKDYPSRIVIHENVYKLNISKMSLVYKTTNSSSDSRKRQIENIIKLKKKK